MEIQNGIPDDSEILALAREYAEDRDGTTHEKIFDTDADLWEYSPELAARAAYVQVLKHWRAQDIGLEDQGDGDAPLPSIDELSASVAARNKGVA